MGGGTRSHSPHPGKEDEDWKTRCACGRGAGGGVQGASPASPGALKLELPAEKCCGGWAMSVSRPPPWIPIFRAAQGPPGTRFPHVRGTAVVTEGEDV